MLIGPKPQQPKPPTHPTSPPAPKPGKLVGFHTATSRRIRGRHLDPDDWLALAHLAPEVVGLT